ncbi:MAG TPA: galactofuranose ABC transporter, permease protein YjfF [Kofleriaceae bacterium]|nr:galactofuranose ABC transporter, permease protein YjfF [Kofleriaceae bacterium]
MSRLSFAATAVVLVLLFGTASWLYPGFLSARVIANLFGDNAALGIAAIGMTFVILSGGIDLSVGAVLAFTSTLVALLVTRHAVPPLLAIALGLAIGAAFGAVMGAMIHRYELPPFLVTLAGMFFARGMAFVLSLESLGISHPFYRSAATFGIPLSAKATLNAPALIFLVLFAAASCLLHATRFGRDVYAVGGHEPSARLLGVAVGKTKIAVYALSGTCSALAGVVATLRMGSGNPAQGTGFELDAIACVVIGGTLLSGGVGSLAGTLNGVLIFGTIQIALVFDGRLNSWWARIVVGALLLLFIVFQKLLARAASRRA